MYSGAAAQPCVEIGYAGGDVVADQPHALDPVNTALGGFVGVPDLEAGSGNVLHAGFAPECDHDVNVADQLWVNKFGCLAGDVDPDLAERLSRQRIDGGAWLGAG